MTISRLDRLRSRRIDPMVKTAKLMNEAYAGLREDDATKYAIGAMQPIDPEYTSVSFSESERIQKHITVATDSHGIQVQYRYQGSVTNDTHIKAHSDIDTLVIHEGFITLQPPQKPNLPYDGNPVQELRELRRISTSAVQSGFSEVHIDTSGARSVTLTEGSLRRKIDLVFANWYNTNDYAAHQQELWRGVNVLNNEGTGSRVMNLPFLHNAYINNKDSKVNGSLRKAIRLLKSLLYDADDTNGLSSYDIASLIWNAPDRLLAYDHGQELQLIQSIQGYLLNVDQNENYRNSIKVPNNTRLIFCSEGATVAELRVVIRHLASLIHEIEMGLQRSFKKLAEARVEY